MQLLLALLALAYVAPSGDPLRPQTLASALWLRVVHAENRDAAADLVVCERGRLHVSAGGCGGMCAHMCSRGGRACDLW